MSDPRAQANSACPRSRVWCTLKKPHNQRAHATFTTSHRFSNVAMRHQRCLLSQDGWQDSSIIERRRAATDWQHGTWWPELIPRVRHATPRRATSHYRRRAHGRTRRCVPVRISWMSYRPTNVWRRPSNLQACCATAVPVQSTTSVWMSTHDALSSVRLHSSQLTRY